MNEYARDVAALRRAAPAKSIWTCHDEYLLASMVHGVDGALVGFASFIPDMIVALWRAVQKGDLPAAMALQARINPLKDTVYGGGEPTSDAHARMALAMYLSGQLASPTVRDPIRQPNAIETRTLMSALGEAGLLKQEILEG